MRKLICSPRRWIRVRVYLPKSLGPADRDRAPLEIDWEAMHKSEIADRGTPRGDDGHDEWDNDVGGSIGLKRATALLPLSPSRKDDIFGWSQAIDAKQPFLAWSFVKHDGERYLAEERQRNPAGSRSEEELYGIWRDAVVEINYRKVARVLKDTRLDREKLGLWRWWLGLSVEPTREERADEGELYAREEEISQELALRAPNGRPNSGIDAKTWSEDDPRPMLDDVWDLIEERVSCALLHRARASCPGLGRAWR